MLKDNKFIKGIQGIISDIPKNYKQFKAFFKETYNKRIIYMYLIDALVLTLIIEMLARHSFMKGIYYLISSPYVIICNAMIILMTLSVTLLMRRRIFGMAIISVVWIVFGIANSVLLSYRVTPFTAVDLMLVDSALDILNKYVSIPVCILIVILAIGAVVGLVYIWFRIPKVNHKINIPRNVGAIAIICAIGMGSVNLGISSDLLATKFGNLQDSYREYGFVYCFVNSLVNTGIDKPSDYSNETIKSLKNKKSGKKKVKKKPNLIFLQLESFFDVNNMKDITFSENPLPTFTELKQNYPHGYFNVPVVGAGTVNIEFEVMTGMNLDDFGPGEYPFKTILKETTCESICYNLKNYGYTCHAVHNNTATFYSRNVVFSNLGYDTFTSIENMHVTDKTQMDWAKDYYLTDRILSCLKSTKEQDYVYTISVQGHGSYPSDEVEYPITISGMEDDLERKYSFEYYVQQINEMDKFINELIAELEALGEETVLVMYGDHLPSLGITEEELINGSVYQTEYIIWSNFETNYESEDVEAYQMQAKILEEFKMIAGSINNYTQKHRKDEDQTEYREGLKNLEYDMLYGEHLLYDGGENPYVATDLQFGLEKVTVSSISPVYNEEGKIFIYGNNFTTYSRVYVNGEKKTTEYVDSSTLVIYYPELEEGDSFSVYQQNSDTHVLSKTDPLVYEDENMGRVESEENAENKETVAVEETTQAKKENKKNDNTETEEPKEGQKENNK